MRLIERSRQGEADVRSIRPQSTLFHPVQWQNGLPFQKSLTKFSLTHNLCAWPVRENARSSPTHDHDQDEVAAAEVVPVRHLHHRRPPPSPSPVRGPRAPMIARLVAAHLPAGDGQLGGP